jgi:hypothetical protein
MAFQKVSSWQTIPRGSARDAHTNKHVMSIWKEKSMTKRAINDVQSFLTFIQTDGGRVYQIVNVELLLRRHPPEAVISFLQELHKDYGKALSKLIQEDKTNSQINELVAKLFRLKMAINTIKNYGKQEAA